MKQIIPLNEREETIANMRYVEGWNAAIEAAAKIAETSKGYPTFKSEEIRKLKK